MAAGRMAATLAVRISRSNIGGLSAAGVGWCRPGGVVLMSLCMVALSANRETR